MRKKEFILKKLSLLHKTVIFELKIMTKTLLTFDKVVGFLYSFYLNESSRHLLNTHEFICPPGNALNCGIGKNIQYSIKNIIFVLLSCPLSPQKKHEPSYFCFNLLSGIVVISSNEQKSFGIKFVYLMLR